MAITYDKDGASIEITKDGVTYRRSIKLEDGVVSLVDPDGTSSKVDLISVNSSGNLIMVLEDESTVTVQADDLTGVEIVTLLEALGVGSRLSHTKLDDVGASDHHAKYLDSEAVTAMGVKGDSNPLHHDKYTDAKAVTAGAAQSLMFALSS